VKSEITPISAAGIIPGQRQSLKKPAAVATRFHVAKAAVSCAATLAANRSSRLITQHPPCADASATPIT